MNCRYYHNEKDIDENPSNSTDIESNDQVLENIVNNCDVEVPALDLDAVSSETDVESSNRESSEEKSTRSNILTEINIEAKNNRNLKINNNGTGIASIPSATSSSTIQTSSSDTDVEPKPSSSSLSSLTQTSDEDTINANVKPIKLPKNLNKFGVTGKPVFNNEFMIELKPSISTGNQLQSNVAGTSTISNTDGNVKKVKKMSLKTSLKPSSCRDSNSSTTNRYTRNTNDNNNLTEKSSKEIFHSARQNTGNNSFIKSNKKLLKKDPLNSVKVSGSVSSRNLNSINRIQRRNILGTSTANNINISSEFCRDNDRKAFVGDEQSNMFLYIDLHGHASKKGIFMYGNYLPKVAEAVECMLLPRLMSLNCHHFHFDACVFSERNMYHKYDSIIFIDLMLLTYL